MKHNGFEYIDLGLPSGTKWAKCNVGANSETDNGLYFPCGGTVAFSYLYYENEFDFNKIKYNGGKKATIHLDNDAAHIHMGGKWHMPTKEQFKELLDGKNTVSTWLHDYCDSGVSGRLFRSRINKETLFIPANGFIDCHASYQNGTPYRKGTTCSLWTSSLDFSSAYICTDFICDRYNTYLPTTSAYHICMGIRGVFNTFWIN